MALPRAEKHVSAVAVLAVGGFVVAGVVVASGEPATGPAQPEGAALAPAGPVGVGAPPQGGPPGAIGAGWVRPVQVQPGAAGWPRTQVGMGSQPARARTRAVQVPELGLEVAPWGGEGVAVARVYQGSWAERAKLAEGDQILAFDRKHVTDLASFVDLVGKAAPEQQTPIAVARNGRLLTSRIMVGEGELEGVTVPADAAPKYGSPATVSPAAAVPAAAAPRWGGGAQGRAPGAALIKPFGMAVVPQAPAGGVVVAQVLGNSHAQAAGLRPGDVIVRLGRTKVHGLAHFQRLVANATPQTDARLKILRNGRSRSVSIMVGEGEMEGVTAAPLR